MLDRVLKTYTGARRTFTTPIPADRCWQHLGDDVLDDPLTRFSGWQPLLSDPAVLRRIRGDRFVLTAQGARCFRWGFTGTITGGDAGAVITGRYGMTEETRQGRVVQFVIGVVLFGVLAFLLGNDIQNVALRVLASIGVVFAFAVIVVIDHRRADVQPMQDDEIIIVGALKRLLEADE